MLVMAVVPNLALACAVGIFIGFGSIAFLTSSTAIVQTRADPMMRGRVLALQGMVFLGSTPVGGPILGWICEAYGARWGIVVGGAACLVAGAWGLVMVRRCERERLDRAQADESVVEAIAEMGGAGVGVADLEPPTPDLVDRR